MADPDGFEGIVDRTVIWAAGGVAALLAAATYVAWKLRRRRDPVREIVRFGVGGARLSAITAERVDYVNQDGEARSVDLTECARTWAVRHGAAEDSEAARDCRCIGERGALDISPWIQFSDQRRTYFEFETVDAALRGDLLRPLEEFRWETFDAG